MKCPRPHWRAETNSRRRAKQIAKRWRAKGYRARTVSHSGMYGPGSDYYEVQTCGRKRKAKR